MPKYTFRLLIEGPDHTGEFVLPIGVTTMGREQGRELVLAHPLISRQHAKIECSDTECYLTDLGSANGTLLNGQPMQSQTPTLLSPGAKISIGPFELTFEALEVADSAPKSKPASTAEVSLFEVIPAQEPPAAVPEPTPARKPAAAQEKPAKAPPEAKRKKEPAAPVPVPEQPGKDKEGSEPPPPQPAAPPLPSDGRPPGMTMLPGLTLHSQRFLEFLPGIYQTDFMSRFLGLFEATSLPIEWVVDNFDLYLDPGTSPEAFLPWLGYWYAMIFDSTWNEEQRRTFLDEAHLLFARRGTRWALTRLLEIYLGGQHPGVSPEIVEFSNEDEPFHFIVRLPLKAKNVDREMIERLVDSSKPAQTMYAIEFKG